jgi:hypothetical protein
MVVKRGAHGYINNLGSAKNGNFIADWEREALNGPAPIQWTVFS